MSRRKSRSKEFGIEPKKGEGWMHFRFHGGPQPRFNRVVLLGSGTFVELQKGIEDLLGSQVDAVFYDAGIRSGKEARETIEIELSEKGEELIKRLFSLMEENGFGWFKVDDLKVNSSERRGIVEVSHSFIAETYGKAERPVCHFVAGFIAGFMSVIWNTEIVCDETSCKSVSGDKCVFEWQTV